MSTIINQYYEQALSGKYHVTFSLTTHHLLSRTYAEGSMTALPGGEVDGAEFQVPTLTSKQVIWCFDLWTSITTDAPPQIMAKSYERLVLNLFPRPLSIPGNVGNLENPAWRDPVAIESLEAVAHGPHTHLLHGLDSNGAVIAITLNVRELPPVK